MAEEVTSNGMGTARDYELQSLDLMNSSGKSVSLIGQLVEIEWHQSIDAPVMFGSIVVVDAQDIMSNFSITGNERLHIKIDQPSLGYPLDREFKVTKISNRTTNNNAGAKYIIHFVSPELVDSNSKAISKAYKGTRYSDIARDVLNNYMKPKKINRIDQTSGAFDVIIPGYRPIEALHWIASRSFDGADSSNFLFFESREGFEYVSLKTLYAQKVLKTMVYDIKSVNEQPNSSSDIKKNRNSIEKLEILQDFDVISTNNRGGYASKLMTVNIFNREYKNFDYSLSNIQGTLLNKNAPTNDKSMMTSYFANYKTHVLVNDTKTEKENAVDKWLMPRQMHNALLDNFAMRSESPLDITVKAGDIIKIDMPMFVAADEKGKKLDQFRSGKYLVRSVSHVFKQQGVGTTILELTTDSFANPLPTEKATKS